MEKILVTCLTETAGLVEADFESGKPWGIIEWCSLLFADVGAEFALLDCLEKSVYLVLVAGCLKLHPPVWQVPHEPGQVETLGNVADRITKAYALDVAFVEGLNGSDHR